MYILEGGRIMEIRWNHREEGELTTASNNACALAKIDEGGNESDGEEEDNEWI